MKKLLPILFTYVLVTASVLPQELHPTLQKLSICLTNKQVELKRSFKICTAEDNQCMLDVMLKVCEIENDE